MNSTIELRSAATDQTAIVLRLWRAGDRFAHAISIANADGTENVVLESVEGDDQQDSPPSPPIQDLSLEKRARTHVALGVGMAGESIWSVSFEAFLGQGRIECDIACNARGAVPLGRSTYRSGDIHLADAVAGTPDFSVSPPGNPCEPLPASPLPASPLSAPPLVQDLLPLTVWSGGGLVLQMLPCAESPALEPQECQPGLNVDPANSLLTLGPAMRHSLAQPVLAQPVLNQRWKYQISLNRHA